MYLKNVPSRAVRPLGPPKHAAKLLATLVLLSAACSDPASQINAPLFNRTSTIPVPGAASGFTVLANAAVTCTNGTITGNVGTFMATPAGSFTQTTCPITGTSHVGDAAAIDAFNGFLTAYTALAPRLTDVCPIITGTLAGQTFAPGVYCVSAEAKTGVLTLNGPPDGVWVFKVAPGAFTGTNFSVIMAGGAQPCNVTWWADAAATLTDSDVKGNILAGAAITLTRGTLNGNAWSRADVTVTGTAVTGCGSSVTPPPPPPVCEVSGDRVTGGGWINGKNGKATFALTGGLRHGSLFGHLSYDDHSSRGKKDDVKAKGTGVTSYVVIDAATRHIEGSAEINGKGGFTYRLDVVDNGGYGRHDSFSLVLSNGYKASGKLQGGNIQLHKSRSGACKDDDKDDDNDEHGGDDDHGHEGK